MNIINFILIYIIFQEKTLFINTVLKPTQVGG